MLKLMDRIAFGAFVFGVFLFWVAPISMLIGIPLIQWSAKGQTATAAELLATNHSVFGASVTNIQMEYITNYIVHQWEVPTPKIDWYGAPMMKQFNSFREWGTVFLPDIEIGLREDGIVVWRKKNP